MRIPWYRIAVTVLWLAAMSWLVRSKILPSLLVGEMPEYNIAASEKPRPPVAWNLSLNNSRLGWALSEVSRQTSDVTETHSLVHFNGSPLKQLLAGIFRQSTDVPIEVESHMLVINSLNQLQHFDCRVRAYPFTGQSLASIEGDFEKDTLMISYRCLDFSQPKVPLDVHESNIRDSFSPETEELRDLHLGQEWSIVTYNPFALPTNPLDVIHPRAPTEILFARVDEAMSLVWNGQPQPVWRVVYRSDASKGADRDNNVRNQLWVRMDGMVLRQEVRFAGIRLEFVRMSDEDASALRNKRKEVFGH